MTINIAERLEAGLQELVGPYTGRPEYGNLQIKKTDDRIVVLYELPVRSTREVPFQPDPSGNVIMNYREELGVDEALKMAAEAIYDIPRQRRERITPEFMREYDKNGLPWARLNPKYDESMHHSETELAFIEISRALYGAQDFFARLEAGLK